MNFQEFKIQLYKISDAEMQSQKEQLQGLLKRARKPAIKAGYALALDEIVMHEEMRSRYPITPDIEAMSLEEVFAELDSGLDAIHGVSA